MHTYSHGERCAIVGGYVYRGGSIPDLRGAYVYGDLCDGKVRALLRREHEVVKERELGVEIEGLVSFGEDPAGELYALSLRHGLYKLTPP